MLLPLPLPILSISWANKTRVHRVRYHERITSVNMNPYYYHYYYYYYRVLFFLLLHFLNTDDGGIDTNKPIHISSDVDEIHGDEGKYQPRILIQQRLHTLTMVDVLQLSVPTSSDEACHACNSTLSFSSPSPYP